MVLLDIRSVQKIAHIVRLLSSFSCHLSVGASAKLPPTVSTSYKPSIWASRTLLLTLMEARVYHMRWASKCPSKTQDWA